MVSVNDAVFITGASSGIGETTARLLASKGFRVFTAMRQLADGTSLHAEYPKLIFPLRIDVTDCNSIRTAAEIVRSTLGDGRLAGLVNNAGIAVAGPLEFVSLDDFEQQMKVNVTGPLAVTQALLPLLRQGRGRIVNIGSISGRFASPMIGPYAASKFALEALTDALRREVASQGVKVSIIEAGPVATPIWEKSRKRMDRDRDPRAEAIYGCLMRAMERYTARAEQCAIPPEDVAQKVLHALTATRPLTRYLVGRKVRWEALAARLLPDRLLDNLVARSLEKWDDPDR